jgi:dolichol-phosphate mannosyltransferase
MRFRCLTVLPVYNEVRYVDDVLDAVSRHSPEVLVVDDGSADGTGELLAARNDIRLLTHSTNRGYGAALITAFQFAIDNGYDHIVTIDCDGQHEPQRIPQFVEACQDVDIVSGSRYLREFPGDSEPPDARRRINQQITAELNRRLGLSLTDAFCGFKAYRVASLKRLHLTDTGYAMPIELWVQAAAAGLEVVELPVPLIYLDEARSFGGALDDASTRLAHYYGVLERSIQAAEAAGWQAIEHAHCEIS